MLYVFMRFVYQFPGMGLPEILDSLTVRWFKVVYVAHLIVMWYLGGALILLAFANLTKRFLSPDTSIFVIITIYLILVALISPLRTDKILYFIEILFIINTPFIVMVIFMTYTSDFMNWDAVREVLTYIHHPPTLTAISAATFIFSGYAVMFIFHRVIRNFRFHLGHLLLIGLLGIACLFTSIFIPVGVLGADGVAEFVFAWVSASDSIRMEYFPIERVMFPFLLFYITIALIGVIFHWHISYKLAESLTAFKSVRSRRVFAWSFFGVVICAAYILEYSFINEQDLFDLSRVWLQLRLTLSF